MNEARNIAFAGLSHLGIVSSIGGAARGFSVLAFDERPSLVEDLTAGRFPIAEPGLEEVFREHRQRIEYTADAGALANCELIFITLDVPTDDANTSNLGPLRALLEKVAASARPGAILVIMSQVSPGFCSELKVRLGTDFRLFYQVETLVFGNAVERAIHPERFMVGCTNVQEGLPDLYRAYLKAFDCPVLLMRYESAELCKIAINCFLVSSISTANMLAEICEKIHADWSEIVPALRLDKRIGPFAYLSPGLGIAGGNLERDLATILKLAADYRTDAGVVEAWRKNSSRRQGWVLRLLSERGLLSGGVDTQVGIWGTAYKADTHSTRNSPSLALIRALQGHRLRAYDPAVKLRADEYPYVQSCTSPLEAAQGADTLVIMTPWREFAQVPLARLKEAMRGCSLVDPFGILDSDSCRRLGFDYYRIGS